MESTNGEGDIANFYCSVIRYESDGNSLGSLLNLIRENKHEEIRRFAYNHPTINWNRFFLAKRPYGCVEEGRLLTKRLARFGHNGDFTVSNETLELLFETKILSYRDIEFLDDYISQCNSQARFDSMKRIIKKFDKDCMKYHRSYNGSTLLHSMFWMYYIPEDRTEWEEIMDYLIDEIGIDICAKFHEPKNDPRKETYVSTVMTQAIKGFYPKYIKKFCEMGVDINERFPDGETDMTPIMIGANSIGKWIRECNGENIKKHINALYETLCTLKELNYNFSVKNKCYSPDPRFVRYLPSDKYGLTLADILRKWKLDEFDSRLQEFM